MDARIGCTTLLLILLLWNSTGQISNIYKQVHCKGKFTLIGTVYAPQEYFTDLNVSNGLYCYRVTHTDLKGDESEPSNVVRVECITKQSCRNVY